MSPSSEEASSSVLWPPIVYAIAALAAGLLTWLRPLSFGLEGGAWWAASLAGLAAIVAGFLIARSGEQRFVRAGTPVRTTQPTTLLVTDGIYARTRNPMYLGLTIFLAGLGLALQSWWFLIAAPIAVFAVIKLAIEREERYLAKRFGQPYLDYRQRVRRWL